MQSVPYSAHLAARLAALFRWDPPVAVRLWSILDGIGEGRILVDDPDAPGFALIQEPSDGTVYVGGRADAERLAEGIATLQKQQAVVICLWADDPLAAMLPPSPGYTGVAIDFLERTPTVELGALGVAPAGYDLRRIDAALVSRLDGFDYYVAMFGTISRALASTIGYCLLDGNEVVCEAVAGPVARGVAEIGVGTRASHQGQGLATVTAAQVILACEQRGYRPFWNAAEQNAPSLALARRLGFRHGKPFRVFAW